MNPNRVGESRANSGGTLNVVLLTLFFAFVLGLVGVAGFFHLSRETGILRDSALSAVPVAGHKRLALHFGFFTTGLVRLGSRFFNLPLEARAGLESIRSGEVGIYKVQATAGDLDTGAILARADKGMSARCWDRVVGVRHENDLVAVYVPRRGVSTDSMRCCVLVLNRENLVVAGASGNLEPLLEIADQHIDLKHATRHLALR